MQSPTWKMIRKLDYRRWMYRKTMDPRRAIALALAVAGTGAAAWFALRGTRRGRGMLHRIAVVRDPVTSPRMHDESPSSLTNLPCTFIMNV